MWKAVAGIAALAVAIVAYFIDDLVRKRRQIDGLPQPPMPNKLLGHLQIAGEVAQLYPKGIHAHVWPDYMRTKYNMPDIFYVDWRPFGSLFLLIADPAVASQYVTTGQSLPKSPLVRGYLEKFLGKNNMVSLEGARWKSIRSMFNPGFSPTNIMNLASVIVDASLTYCEVIQTKAETGELFELEDYLTKLTIDIIGRVVLDTDMSALKRPHPISRLFRERARLMPPSDALFPWQAVDLLRPLKLFLNGRKLDREISKELDLKIYRRAKEIAEEEQKGANVAKKRSVVDLALNAYEKEASAAKGGSKVRIATAQDLPNALRADIIDSVKTFIFAGHDTTSSTLCWASYLLHRHPEVYAKLKAELDNVFPGKLVDTAAKIKEDPYSVNKLEYTTAVLRETLRLFPPASTIRIPVPNGYLIDPRTQARIPMLPDSHPWPVAHMIHRHPRFFPRPVEFIPERFIASQTPFPEAELFTEAGRDAFRPFEKGPRNCIGQELAMLEGKIFLALTAREFDFVLEYPGEAPDVRYPAVETAAKEVGEDTEYGRGVRDGTIRADHVEGHRVFPCLLGTAKPIGGCPGRIYFRTQ
ncbi:cytochrome P450 [Hypoxylon cercidicola]|nr:cytochrome P450 [Hypoxylon cercidicola]